jgi:LmbE family N-acetylglucosaminyl deacetylase
MNYKTLIISPHCDDEVLGCGGAIHNRPEQCFVYYLGADVFHVVKREIRMKEVADVAKFLHFDYKVGNNPVNHYKREDLINEITDVINEVKPEEIFIPNSSYNQDHKETYDACIVALRPHDINHFVPKVFVYEVDQYILWEGRLDTNYIEEIDVSYKEGAYALHASQVRSFRPMELIRAIAVMRGLSCGVAFAESFKILRYVNKK